MSLLNKLKAGESSLTGLDGNSPPIVDQALSTLHNEYSLHVSKMCHVFFCWYNYLR